MRSLPVLWSAGMVAVFCAATCLTAAALDGHPLQILQSHITVMRVYSERRNEYDPVHHRMRPISFADCADFSNDAKRTTTDVQLMFALAAAGGAQKARALPYDARAALAPGQPGHGCRTFGYPDGFHGRILVAWVNAVTYDDGKNWHAAPPVEGTVNAPSSGVIALGKPMTYLPLEECDSITNHSRKAIAHVQIVFRHLSLDGVSLGEDALDVRKNIAPGQSLKNACRTFNGYSRPSLFEYAIALSSGKPAIRPPQIFVSGQESRLSVTLTAVDFAAR